MLILQLGTDSNSVEYIENRQTSACAQYIALLVKEKIAWRKKVDLMTLEQYGY